MEQKGIIKYLMLPSETTAVELAHVRKINKVALWACFAHIPLFVAVAAMCGTSITQALVFGGLLLLGPMVASKTIENPRTLSLVYGFTSMGLGALLVHLGQSAVQIEMHFHFFASLALLTVWGNPLIIWVATLTVASHHALFWLFLPQSVFNYEAPYWVVGIHATFVVVEAIAASYIARNFYDNVIGLEKIVQAKTVQLNKKNDEMRVILDNTSQGFLVVGRDGQISGEKSAVFKEWFGDTQGEQVYWDFLFQLNTEFGRLTKFGFEDMNDDLLPMDYYLDSLPSRLELQKGESKEFFEFKYSPVANSKDFFLVVVSNITERLKSEREARRQMEVIGVFNIIANDRDGFEEFLADSDKLVKAIVSDNHHSDVDVARMVHTLKGNAGVFQVTSIATVCHEVENKMQENLGKIRSEDKEYLQSSWNAIKERLSNFLSGNHKNIEITKGELSHAIEMIENNKPADLKQVMMSWQFEPTRKRLDRIASQAASLADRLNKGKIDVEIKDNNLRLNKDEFLGFWSVFNHVLRNAIDHGLESPDDRKGKSPNGKLTIETTQDKNDVVISIMDDGKGIDIAEISKKAGLSPEKVDSKKLLELICQDGLSTKSEANDTSGRGVGMAAVKSYCDNHAIVINLETRKGGGTKFEFRRKMAA